MNQLRMSTIITRLRNAWQALRDKPYKTLTIGVETHRCDMCDYYKAAHEPAQITQAAPKAKYFHEIEYQKNRVLVTFYEATEDGGVVEIASGYGHIRSKGPAGVAQATSYALTRIWYKLPKPGEGGGQ